MEGSKREKIKRLTEMGREVFDEESGKTLEERLEVAREVVEGIDERGDDRLSTPEWYKRDVLLGAKVIDWCRADYLKEGMEEELAAEKGYLAGKVVVDGLKKFREEGGLDVYKEWYLDHDESGNPKFVTTKRRRKRD
ncbi:hypothetical protein FWD07_01835 [Candidatus Saccharibacteria bacterium]|nr:hypothetical protein [Candidatus Saccharibacteria bacterium]